MAFLVFLRHSITLGGCSFSDDVNNLILSLTGDIMIMFFMISGFTLYYVNAEKNLLLDSKDLLLFYKKRALSIFPLYLFVECFRIFESFLLGTSFDMFRKLPVRFLGIQINYNSVDIYSGGSWFLSCLILCYFVFPLICYIISHLSSKYRLGLLIVIVSVLTYSKYLETQYSGVNMYYNPFFRCLEFTIGMLLCSLICLKQKKCPLLAICVIVFCVLIGPIREKYRLLNFAQYVILIGILLCSYFLRMPHFLSKPVKYLASISYEFFLLQDILFSPVIIQPISQLSYNLRFPIYFLFLLSGSIVWRAVWTRHVKIMVK